MIKGIFSLQDDTRLRNKHSVSIKKILGKMVKKLGLKYLKQITPEKHHKLLAYIERERRKKISKKKKEKLNELLGEYDKL